MLDFNNNKSGRIIGENFHWDKDMTFMHFNHKSTFAEQVDNYLIIMEN